MITFISSEKNQIIKDIIKLKTKKERDKTGLFYIEGERFINELLTKNFIIQKIIMSKAYYENNINNSSNINKYEFVDNIVLDKGLFDKISDTINPQGILAICKKINNQDICDNLFNNNNNNLFIVLDRITDPGNLGTIIRTSEALGANAIFLSSDCVDLYNPKVLRSTMGSIFHIPIVIDYDLDELINKFKSNNINIICTHLKGNSMPYEVNLTTNIAVLVGNEANGVLDKYVEQADTLIKIPMLGQVESLNVSVSASIILYEVLRQRLVK